VHSPLRRPGLAAPFLLAALLTVLFAPAARAAGDEADRAKALIDAGHPADAVPVLEGALQDAPDDARLHFLLGVALHRGGRVADAVPHLERAAALNPDDGLVRYNLGAAYFALGRFEEAAEAFLAVPERSPAMAAAAWLNAGLVRAKQGRAVEARELFQRAVDAEPEGKPAESARRMLALLEWTEAYGPEGSAQAGAEAAADVAAAERRGPAPGWRQTVAARLGVGREFDTNVFSLPDDTTTTEEHDWRTALRARAETRIALPGGVRFTPRYDFYGHWYDQRTEYDYMRHWVLMRFDWRGPTLEPRLEYAYTYSVLGADPFLATHRIGGRVALSRSPGRRVWAAAHVELDEAPGTQYDFLSGTEWEGSLSLFRPWGDGGSLYASLALRRLDRGTQVTSTYRADYSYTGFEPYVYVTHLLPWWHLSFTGTGRYEFRYYANPDTWTAPGPGGSRRRQDHRITATLALSRPLGHGLEVELGWEGQVRESTIGNGRGDPVDRDYTREVMGVFLKGEI
jgi:tetratricopeptide (TPR) repeat protein